MGTPLRGRRRRGEDGGECKKEARRRGGKLGRGEREGGREAGEEQRKAGCREGPLSAASFSLYPSNKAS